MKSPNPADTNPRTAHASDEWIARSAGVDLSPLGVKVARILGHAFAGIYHIRREVLHTRVKWDDPEMIVVVLGRGPMFATYDGDALTRLVVLAHEYAVRISITGAARDYVRLTFSGREREAEATWDRHPTIDDAVADIRRVLFYDLPADEPAEGAE